MKKCAWMPFVALAALPNLAQAQEKAEVKQELAKSEEAVKASAEAPAEAVDKAQPVDPDAANSERAPEATNEDDTNSEASAASGVAEHSEASSGGLSAEDVTPSAESVTPEADAVASAEASANESMAPEGTGDIVKPHDGVTPVSDFVDTRLSFSLSDDDFLAGPGDTRPNSPSIDFAPRRSNKLFFENLNRRDSGQETLTHLVLYRHLPGFFPSLDTEAALVMRFNLYANDETGKRLQSFYDDGTYLKLGWYPGGTVQKGAPNFALTMFPFDTNRFRLGYLYDISWGGANIFPSQNVSSPGAKLQFNWGPFYMYGGAKTARMLDENINEIESNWGGLTGFGIDIADIVTLEAGGGYFLRGTNPLTGVEGEALQGYGASGRAVFHYGTGAGSSADFRLYQNDPAMTDLFLQNGREYKTNFSAFLAAEYTMLQQTLQSGDAGKLSTTVAQTGTAAALSAKFHLWYFDLGADFIYRDLAFVLFNRPSFVPYQDFPSSAILEPETMFAASLAAHAPAIRSTFALVFGAQLPATFTGLLPDDMRSSELPDTAGSQTVVVRNAGSVDILPCSGYDDPTKPDRVCTKPYTRSPIWALRGAAKFDVSPMMSLVAETTLMIDNNQTDIIDDEQGQVSRVFVTTGELGFPLRFGAGLFAQVRF